MPPRASWNGQLKISLITLPVRMYNAVTSTARVTLNQLHQDCHQRLRNNLVCPEHGEVPRSEVVKGYQYEKGKYVVIEDEDLEKIRLETDKTIEIVQFCDGADLDPIYLNSPYYLAPDGPVAEEAFRVIREALRASEKIGIGRVVMTGKEQTVSLQVEDRGFRLTTLRSDAEVRGSAAYFEDIKNGQVPEDQLELATRLIESKSAPLHTSELTDRYQEALLEIVKAKIEGTEPVLVQQSEAGKVLNFMDALKKSVESGVRAAAARKKPKAKSIKKTAGKKKKAKRA